MKKLIKGRILAKKQEINSKTMAPSAPSSQASGQVPISITASLWSKIRELRQHTTWSYRRIACEISIAVTTVYSICSAPATPQKKKMG